MLLSYQRALPEEQELTGQTGLSGEANAKTDWATDSPEKKRRRIRGSGRRTRDSARKEITEKFLVVMRFRETPVYIPNTLVKPEAADGTMLETAWESRWLPDYKMGL